LETSVVEGCYLNDGKLPNSLVPNNIIELKIPKTFDVNGIKMVYSSNFGFYVEPQYASGNPVNSPRGANYMFFGANGGMVNIVLDNAATASSPGTTLSPTRKAYWGRVGVRWRQEYEDWTFGGIYSVKLNYNGTSPPPYPYECYPGQGVSPTCVDRPGWPNLACCDWECLPTGIWTQDRQNCINCGPSDIDVTSENSCRSPDPLADCGECITTPNVHYTTLPSYPNYFDGCTGRPIDIDIDGCNGLPNPQAEDFLPAKTGFVLYYNAGPTQPFLIIDNIAYDTRGADLVKIFTTSTPNEMREQVCTRLRFANLVNSGLLSTDINSALISNWPYNDLYWLSSCSGLPGEVPINLIPC
jgi:hypothetical protein